MKEITLLKKQKLEAEENLLNKSVELTKTKDNLNKHHLAIHSHDSFGQISKIENQVNKKCYI